jgi:ABC-2 type transport system permease protein
VSAAADGWDPIGAPPSPLALFRRTTMARAYPRVRGIVRDRAWLITEIVLPLLGVAAMVYVYRSLGAPHQYLGFVVLGGAMLAYWQNVLWSMATQLYWDRDAGNLEIYAVSPCSFIAVLLGMAVGGMLMTTARAIVVLVVGSLVFSVDYVWGGVPAALGIFALTMAALYLLGCLLGALFLFYGRDAWNLASALQEPVYFVSGFYFPVRSLTAAVGGVASLLPITLGLDGLRQLLLPGTPALVGPQWEALALVVLTPVYGALALYALRRIEAIARREGRLILRGA